MFFVFADDLHSAAGDGDARTEQEQGQGKHQSLHETPFPKRIMLQL